MSLVSLTPQQRVDVTKVLDEISNAMTRSEAEREYIREAVKEASDKYQIPKKVFRNLATIHHKQNVVEFASHNEEVVDTYALLTGKQPTP